MRRRLENWARQAGTRRCADGRSGGGTAPIRPNAVTGATSGGPTTIMGGPVRAADKRGRPGTRGVPRVPGRPGAQRGSGWGSGGAGSG